MLRHVVEQGLQVGRDLLRQEDLGNKDRLK